MLQNAKFMLQNNIHGTHIAIDEEGGVALVGNKVQPDGHLKRKPVSASCMGTYT